LHRVELLPRVASGDDAIIVAAAAKNFIPFLFGAWDTDVSVYPRTIAPEAHPPGFGIDVVFDAFTPRGHAVIPSIASQLSALAIGLVGATWTVRWLPVQLATKQCCRRSTVRFRCGPFRNARHRRQSPAVSTE
jgi:hypothetical protein